MNSAPTPADLPGVLVLVSNPHDAPVSIHADLAALREAVQDLPYAAAFTAGVAEVDAVADLLARRDRPRCRVLHFVGHGSPPDGDDDDGRLVFEQRSGAARGMDRATLAATLAPTGSLEFDLAILSACHSERIAATLTTLGVRHAVAIEADESVYEIAAVKFYGRFYRTLLTGGTVAEAFSAGCNAVRTDARLGGRAAGEVAKFRLLPAAGDHAVAIFPARVDGALVFHDLPVITQPNFDAPPVGFIGRGRDKLTVVEALAARRGVLLKGVSGIGKTATGREVSRWLAERGWCDPGHAYFVALRDAGNAADVRTALLLSLALPAGDLPAGADAADKWLADRLPPRCLLLLDEAENAVHGGGLAVRNLLERLVASRSRPLVIVTSQVDVGSPALPVIGELHAQRHALDLVGVAGVAQDALLVQRHLRQQRLQIRVAAAAPAQRGRGGDVCPVEPLCRRRDRRRHYRHFRPWRARVAAPGGRSVVGGARLRRAAGAIRARLPAYALPHLCGAPACPG